MPLYLVRWPDLTASLISAKSEDDLLSQIDEVESPRGCTWSRYSGPLWVDFQFPADVRATPPAHGELEREHVRVRLKGKAPFELDALLAFGSEAQADMLDAILSKALPSVAALKANLEGEPKSAELKAAIADDVVMHDRKVRYQGIALEKNLDGALVMRRSETWCFLRKEPGKFIPYRDQDVASFAVGKRKIKPDASGKVRVAYATVVFESRRAHAIESISGLALSTRPDGLIADAHRADAFDREEVNPLKKRRDSLVQWELDENDQVALRAAVRKKAGT